jgi:putative membrane protein
MKPGILNDSELKRLADVIQEIERKTSAEIRLMIVGSSASYTHVVPMLWTLLLAICGVVFWIESSHFEANAGWWLWPSAVGVTWVAAILLSKLASVRRWFGFDLNEEVWKRAELEFYREGLTATTGATGVLVFLSLLEREAVVLGDKSIAAVLPKDTWDQMIGTILEGARKGQWAPKLEEALRLCGDLLAAKFPIQAGDRNELANHVIVKD